jgi:hypothetical protein
VTRFEGAADRAMEGWESGMRNWGWGTKVTAELGLGEDFKKD